MCAQIFNGMSAGGLGRIRLRISRVTTLVSILSNHFPILHSGVATRNRAFAGISVARPVVTVCIFDIFLRISHSPGNSWFQIPDLTVTTWLRFLITLDCAPSTCPQASCPRGNHVRAF